MELWPGRPAPLGATYDGSGTNFSIFSEMAERVELCLFDEDGRESRHALPERTGFVWHGYAPEVGEGQRYGYRVHGTWDPAAGRRANPAKLLVDPYAKVVVGGASWHPTLQDHEPPSDPSDGAALRQDHRDDADAMPRSVVANPWFDWGADRPPATPWHDSVIYEAHVKGLTWRHPEVPAEHRGTFLGVAHPAIVEHLHSLGVTALELLPVHQFFHDRHLVELGLRNYWGYNSLGYLAPHGDYAARPGGQVHEFKTMVKELHAAGIEVILDVVYNHTSEGGTLGPTLAFRGIDNAAYYRLDPADRFRYVDYTGTRNSLNMQHPNVLQLIMDSLRYWVAEMRVDGFRFDLAAALARELHDVDRLSSFFDLIQQDPIVQRVKLIAEPWDVGEGGYQVGNFPPQWTEWNGKFRDTVRDYWRPAGAPLDDVAQRFAGSPDLYRYNGRRPFASINFVTCHDGFTLADLVRYDHKHNEANGEANRDGSDDNRSWNGGVEGPTDDDAIRVQRRRRQRALLATLLLSQGVPMLLGGDELGRTQAGNNNAYCLDDETSWIDWDGADTELVAFVGRLTALRRAHPVLRQRRWLVEPGVEAVHPSAGHRWLAPDGTDLVDADLVASATRPFGWFLDGTRIPSTDEHGHPVVDDRLLIWCNGTAEPVEVHLPPDPVAPWRVVLDSSPVDPTVVDDGTRASADEMLAPGALVCVDAWSVRVLLSPVATS
jgi:glycogen operon protein